MRSGAEATYAAGIDLADPDTYQTGIPHNAFRELRRHNPVSWCDEPNGAGFWAITRYHDVLAVLRNPAQFSSWRGSALIADSPPPFLAKLREGMLNQDPPSHTLMRRLVNKAFSPKRVAELEARIAERARALVDRVADRGECDFAEEVAGGMPLFVICEILGVPPADRERLYTLTQWMLGTEQADRTTALEEKIKAAAEMRAYAAELGRNKRERPGDDLVSDLLTARVDGRELTDGEFEAFFLLLFNAGSDTTRSLLCFGLDILLERAELVQRLRDRPDLVPTAIEEMLRYEAPIIQFRRTTTCEVELAGRRIAEGQKVVVFFPSANRDETVFTDPDRFDIDRSPNDHVSFGHGPHFCLGATLARIESKHVLWQVLERLQALERRGPLIAARTNFVRGVKHLPIAFRVR